MAIISKEKINKPRFLLLDFNKGTEVSLQDLGFSVWVGQSGFKLNPNPSEDSKPTTANVWRTITPGVSVAESNRPQREFEATYPFDIPIHHSEVEIIIWNCLDSTIPSIYVPGTGRTAFEHAMEAHAYKNKLIPYFRAVKFKGGIIVVLLGFDTKIKPFLPDFFDASFSIVNRNTTTLEPTGNEDPLASFITNYVSDGNVKVSISWDEGVNAVNLDHDHFRGMLEDESDHYHALYSPDTQLLLLPQLNSLHNALKALAQDVIPTLVDDSIYPFLNYSKWLQDDDYLLDPVKNIHHDLAKLETEYQNKVKSLEAKLVKVENDYGFLGKMLVSDDSNQFPKGERLTDHVSRALEVIGFSVEDIDKINQQMEQSLKEDFQVTDNDYFAITEVKGSISGARANWINKDLRSHILTYIIQTNTSPGEVNGMLVFNHDRRIAPKDRSIPFENDPGLVKLCESERITLVPVYELYKLCSAVLFEGYDKQTARESLKKPGLFSFASEANNVEGDEVS